MKRRLRRCGAAAAVVAAIALVVGSTWAVAAIGRDGALGPAVPSPIEQLPVPGRAAMNPTIGGQGVGALTYRLPKGTTRNQLERWYDSALPWRHPFSTWAWCTGTRARGLTQRTWTHPGTAELLALALVYDRRRVPVGILVTETANGRCRPTRRP